MRYVGIIKTGNDEISSEILYGIDGVERIIPGSLGNRLITGTILNPSKIRGLLIIFYSQNREAQAIRLDPQQRLIIKNQPCDRLIIKKPPSESQAFFDYTLRVFETDSDQELMVFLSDSVLEIDTESDNSIDYVEVSSFRSVAGGQPNPVRIAVSNPGTEEIIDRIFVVASTFLGDVPAQGYAMTWSMLLRGFGTQIPIGWLGARFTSYQTAINLSWPNEVVLQETSLESTELVLSFLNPGGVTLNYPYFITFRQRALRSIPAIIYDGGDVSAVTKVEALGPELESVLK